MIAGSGSVITAVIRPEKCFLEFVESDFVLMDGELNASFELIVDAHGLPNAWQIGPRLSLMRRNRLWWLNAWRLSCG
jgi:hypothetical protein